MGGTDPDLQKIRKNGVQSSRRVLQEENSDDEDETFDKFMPKEFAKRIPGFDLKEIKGSGIHTVVDLCKMELGPVLGEKKARTVKEFLERTCKFKNE